MDHIFENQNKTKRDNKDQPTEPKITAKTTKKNQTALPLLILCQIEFKMFITKLVNLNYVIYLYIQLFINTINMR